MVPSTPPRDDQATDGAPESLSPEDVTMSRAGSVPTFSGEVVILKVTVDEEFADADWKAMMYFLFGSFHKL